ncbi:TPA: hypothetical protein ACH3X2_003073 [Trebouxia sp. C0005]
MAYKLTQAALAKIVNIAAERTESALCHKTDPVLVCLSGSVEEEHHRLFDCPANSHIQQQYSHLFHQASPSVAAFLATDQFNVVGSHLKTCFAQRQSVLASPLLVWLLNFVELVECRACGVAVLGPSFITASL